MLVLKLFEAIEYFCLCFRLLGLLELVCLVGGLKLILLILIFTSVGQQDLWKGNFGRSLLSAFSRIVVFQFIKVNRIELFGTMIFVSVQRFPGVDGWSLTYGWVLFLDFLYRFIHLKVVIVHGQLLDMCPVLCEGVHLHVELADIEIFTLALFL